MKFVIVWGGNSKLRGGNFPPLKALKKTLAVLCSSPALQNASTHTSAPSTSPTLSSSSSLSPWNSLHLTRKCSTSSTSPLPHSMHLSSSVILHLFLSSNNPADPVRSRNLHLTASCPNDESVYLSASNSSFAVLYHLKLLLPSTSSHQFSTWTSSILDFTSRLDSLSQSSANPYLLCSSSYSSHHPTPPVFFSFSATTFTNLLSSRFSNLFPYSSFLSSRLFSSFLQPKSPLTAAPATVLLAPSSLLPILSWAASNFLFTVFPPGHHTSAACSKPGLARSSHTNLPLSTSTCPSFLLIHSIFPAHSSAFSAIFSTCTLPHIPLSNHKPKYLNTFTSSISCPLILQLLPPLDVPTTIILVFTALNVNLHSSAYSPTVSSILCSSSGDSANKTISSAYSNAPHHPSSSLTPRPLSSSSSTIPITYILYNKGDKGHPCLRPFSTLNHLDCSPSKTTLASTSSYKPWHTLTNFWVTPYRLIFSHSPSRHTVSYALLTSRKARYVPFLLLLLSSHTPLNASIWSAQFLFPQNPPCASVRILSSANSPSLLVKHLVNTFATQLPSAIPL